ncbi:hypothetical protein EVAR_62775_1 [Eumeta japonica]|uniref:Uncharacterized protein n=1 Tax=Eumeta variegata TaxID=151549 RepID=A0A4C1Z045_EUMVA|nr:hypothetical protein EVAR_62775_1 [Eumeta japonica]
MLKWWVAAPSGPEKLADGEPRWSRKPTMITHLKRPGPQNLTSIGSRTIKTAILNSDIDSGPCLNGRRYRLPSAVEDPTVVRAADVYVMWSAL